jgi:hypothetical protein
MDKVSRSSILVEVCKPRDKEEKALLGTTTQPDKKNFYEIWIDSSQSKDEFVDTFYHEITHAFIGMYFKNSIPEKVEHRMCELIGYFARSVISAYVAFRR